MKAAWRITLIAVIALIGIQVIPYGRSHSNPPVISEPAWDSPKTRELTVRACYDCHSNETIWPWYSNIAPVSWLIQQDTDRGRQELNYSGWGSQEPEGEDSAETVRNGEMPPWYYRVMQPKAQLSQEELDSLIRGLEATFGIGKERARGEGED